MIWSISIFLFIFLLVNQFMIISPCILQLPVFDQWSDTAIKNLIILIKPALIILYQKNTIVVCEQDPPIALYVIIRGRWDIMLGHWKNSSHVALHVFRLGYSNPLFTAHYSLRSYSLLLNVSQRNSKYQFYWFRKQPLIFMGKGGASINYFVLDFFLVVISVQTFYF